MPDVALFCNRFLWGCVVGCLCYLMRSNIDQRKGLLVELATVVLPILMLAVGISLTAEQDWRVFGNRLAVMIQFLFLSLPIFVVVRLTTRFRQGETPQLTDLFRITTVISLGTFIFSTFPNPISLEALGAILVTYFLGEWAKESERPGRAWSLAILAVAMLWLLTPPFMLDTSLLAFDRGWADAFVGSARDAGELAFAAAILIFPLAAERWLTNWPGWHRFAHRVDAWRFAMAEPRDQIFSRPLAALWRFRKGTVFLNHGSFGAVPLAVREVQRNIRAECEDQPMDFLARQLEPRWLEARFQLATWLGTQADNVAFCENATAAMNELASWFPLQATDQVLMNDHEYGAVQRIWQRKCHESQATLTVAELPADPNSPHELTQAILDACTDHTRLVIVSHITSPTAIRMPVEQLCSELKRKNIAVCVDGPHALLQEDLKLCRLDCDFYTASCHKWLCAPIGSGFLYVAPDWQPHVQPARLSWGRLPPTAREKWSDELLWTGTRDYSPYLTVPDAIRFFQSFERDRIDQRNHELACYARRRLSEIPGAHPVTPEGREWYGWMVGVWLPPAAPEIYDGLQQRLFEKYGIEVPIVHFRERYLVRVSCHLHTTTYEIDLLYRALMKELRSGL